MAITISSVLNGAKNPAIVSGGILLGVGIQKGINAVLNTDMVQEGIGSDNALALKNYASPAITSALGIIVAMNCEDDLICKLATGVAISGTLNVGMQLFTGKPLLAGTNGGIMGFLGDDPDYDYEVVDDPEPEPAPATPIAGLGSNILANPNMNVPVPATRDTPWEGETYGNFGALAGGTYNTPLVF